MSRFSVSGSAGVRDGKRFAVLDSLRRDQHGGMLRVSFHRTFQQAKRAARRLNENEAR